jgi:tryptophan synthase alpha subunit
MGLGSDLSRYGGLAEGVIVGSELLAPLLDLPGAAARERSVRDFAQAFRKKLGDLAPA